MWHISGSTCASPTPNSKTMLTLTGYKGSLFHFKLPDYRELTSRCVCVRVCVCVHARAHPLVKGERLKVFFVFVFFFLASSWGQQYFVPGWGWIPVGMEEESSTESRRSHTRTVAVEMDRKAWPERHRGVGEMSWRLESDGPKFESWLWCLWDVISALTTMPSWSVIIWIKGDVKYLY